MTKVLPKTLPQATPKNAEGQDAVREVVGMRRWLRLTARKHSSGKKSDNDAARAAAEAVSRMLKDARKIV